MKKIQILILAVIFVAVQPITLLAAIFINQQDAQISHIRINNCNYITPEDAANLFGYLPPEGTNHVPIRAATENFFIRWDEENVYLDSTSPQITRQTIGQSHQNRPIEAIYLTPPSYSQTIMAVFALHGLEDHYYRDGAALVQIAETIIQHYSDHPELLKFTRLIIIPCVNPDGVYAGNSKDGFGRCNAQGIDINRDFDYNWGKINTARYKTGSTPFASVEAQALRDIVLNENPDIVLDFHGWLDCCYTNDPEIKNIFTDSLSLGVEKPAFPGFKPQQGYFYGWATQYARAALIEYPCKNSSVLANQTIQGLNQLCQ